MRTIANFEADTMRRLFVGLVAVAILGGVRVGLASVIDDFNDNSFDTSLWTPSVSGTGVTMAETNQRIEISFNTDAQSADSTGGFGANVLSRQMLCGNFDVSVDYELLNWPVSNGVRIGMHVFWNSPPHAFYAVERVSFGTPLDFPSFPRENYLVHAEFAIEGITPTTDQNGSLRLSRAGDVVTAYYYGSTDWVYLTDFATTSDPMAFDLAAWSHDNLFADAPVAIAFDNVRGSGVCGISEPASLLV